MTRGRSSRPEDILQCVSPKPAGKALLKSRYARCVVGLDEDMTPLQQKQKAAVWGRSTFALLNRDMFDST